MDSISYPLNLRGLDKASLKRSFLEWLVYSAGKAAEQATPRDWFVAVALAVRDRLVDNWIGTTRRGYQSDQKRVYYLSMEFLVGRLLTNALANLGIVDACREALAELGIDLDQMIALEPDAALGNGGLGRLAACFLDSMASVGIAGNGYGIRYEFGLFEQHFENGWQIEQPEDWLRNGNPWEFERPEVSYPVEFHGHVQTVTEDDGTRRTKWLDTERVLAVAYDTPVVGWGGETINTLRLWSARPTSTFNLADFNRGDYLGAVEKKVLTKNLSRVLYPNDATEPGQELRFKQEYFFTAASVQDILRRFRQMHDDFDLLPDKVAIHLNDTHPAIAVAELMRLLVDQYEVPCAKAWDLTRNTIAYTNHTLMPEALESWPVRLIERVLPRHMAIIYDINARFLQRVRTRSGADDDNLARLSLIDERDGKRVRMGHLAFVGAHKVNGVSALHTELMKTTVFSDLHEEFPDRIVNKTNGITPRRWLHQCNPSLSRLITEAIGDGWIGDLEQLVRLARLADDAGFRAGFAEAKRRNKLRLADTIKRIVGIEVDPEAMFDIQVKRIHEYKRQLLNLIQTVALYNAIREQPDGAWTPRVKIFAGKAAPAYTTAKMIIKLVNDVARVVNADPAMRGRLKVVQLPNYNVSLAEQLIPAADLSEQISTAGLEASGTGNMKFALNGALTIGTLDGANVEIREQVGADNIFIFGLTADEVAVARAAGYDARATVTADPRLSRALAMIADGEFSPEDRSRFRGLIDGLLGDDRFMVTADFAAYLDAQAEVDRVWGDRTAWLHKAVLNTAHMGWFSSDRTVREYAAEIWNALPVTPARHAAE